MWAKPTATGGERAREGGNSVHPPPPQSPFRRCFGTAQNCTTIAQRYVLCNVFLVFYYITIAKRRCDVIILDLCYNVIVLEKKAKKNIVRAATLHDALQKTS